MKKGIRLLSVLLLITTVLTLGACGKNDDGGAGGGGGGEGGGGTQNTPIKYTVTFEGTNLPSQTVDENYLLQKPAAPADTETSQFAGWYTDADFTTPAAFPITVKSDTKLYAKYILFRDYFLMARENTVGDGVSGFEYDYNWNISVSVPVVGAVEGVQVGTSKYSSQGAVSYLDHHVNSGLLFNDGEIYKYTNGQTFNEIELDETGKIVDYSSEASSDTPKYDSSSLAKALFTYTEEDIKSVEKSGNAYLIKTKANASNIGSLILNNINHPIVEKALTAALPDTESEASFTVTYDGDKIASYDYNFSVSVSLVTLQIKYTIDFEKVNEIPSLTLPTFENLYITPSEVSTHLTAINTAIDAFKSKEVGSNTFELKTGVDYGLTTGSIDATYAGESKRANSGSSLSYINLIEVDSDLKNNDLYASTNLTDVKYVRGNTSNGTVYDRLKKLVGYDTPVEANVSGRGNADKYYLLLDSTFLNSSNINSVSVSENEDNTVYSLTLTEGGAFAFMDYINTYATLNPFVSESTGVKVLGDYDRGDFSITKANITVTVNKTTNALVSVDASFDAKTNVKFEGSRDFEVSDRASVSVDWKFTVTSTVTEYTAPENATDLKY